MTFLIRSIDVKDTRSDKTRVGKNDGGQYVEFPVLLAVIQLVLN